MQGGVVPRILSRQRKKGYWETPQDFYVRAKYRGTVWQVIILAELGADGRDDRIKKACEFIINISQDRQSGGFCYRGTAAGGGFHSCIIPCLTGNLVWSLLRFGCAGDPRVEQGIHWITAHSRFDDGEGPGPMGWPYDKREVCWGKHTCLMGVVKCLKALAEIPKRAGRPRWLKPLPKGLNISSAIIFLKEAMICPGRPNQMAEVRVPHGLGQRCLGGPYDIDPVGLPRSPDGRGGRARAGQAKQPGRWLLENTFNGRFQVNVEQKGKPSKWLTLNAIQTLRAYFSPGKTPHHGAV